MADGSDASWLFDAGTPVIVDWTNEVNILPTKNWRTGSMEDATAKIGHEAVAGQPGVPRGLLQLPGEVRPPRQDQRRAPSPAPRPTRSSTRPSGWAPPTPCNGDFSVHRQVRGALRPSRARHHLRRGRRRFRHGLRRERLSRRPDPLGRLPGSGPAGRGDRRQEGRRRRPRVRHPACGKGLEGRRHPDTGVRDQRPGVPGLRPAGLGGPEPRVRHLRPRRPATCAAGRSRSKLCRTTRTPTPTAPRARPPSSRASRMRTPRSGPWWGATSSSTARRTPKPCSRRSASR